MYFIRFTKQNRTKLKQVEEFLNSLDLSISLDIEEFIIAKDDMKIVASGGISGNILKCIGVAPEFRGKGVMLKLMSELMDLAYSKGRCDLFLFSKYENRELFESCGFKVITDVKQKIVLMENSNNLAKYKKNLISCKKNFSKIGSIVMNANPFTLGHKYLVEQAKDMCDWLHIFIVKEDLSFFSFKQRFKLVKDGLKDIKNITLFQGSEYIISRATFPTYFLKEEQNIDTLYSTLDALIFKEHIVPSLGITHRFLGSEPNCVVTNDYNKQIKKTLFPEVEVVEIERKRYKNEPISASKVRDYLKQNRFDKIKQLVPQNTYEYLKNIKEI